MSIQQEFFKLTAVNLGEDNIEVVLILYSIEKPALIRNTNIVSCVQYAALLFDVITAI